MTARPSAIIFINTDLTENVKSFFIKQLHINEVIDGYVFDTRLSHDATYPDKVHQLDIRLMVVRSLAELQNRQYADVVLFFKNGLVCVEENKYGPPGITFPVVNLTLGKLGLF
jgi:hypothetical protein